MLSRIQLKLQDLRLRLKQDYWIRELDYSKEKILLTINGTPDIRSRIFSCRKEPETVAWLEKNFGEKDVLVDIGANVGAYSLVAAKIGGKNSLVYAFEPSFLNFYCLSKNILINELSEKIYPFQISLADGRELGRFFYRNLKHGGSGNQFRDADDTRVVKHEYQQYSLSYTLDEFLKDFKLRQPTMLKLDVDGNEPLVLAGAKSTLAHPECKTLLVEIDESCKKSFDDTLKIINAAGFQFEGKHSHAGGGSMFNYIYNKK